MRGKIMHDCGSKGRAVLPFVFAVLGLLLHLAWIVQADEYATGYAAFQRRDYTTAFRTWEPLAQQGMAVAQFNLGILYARGLGVTQDYAIAARWFRRAADQGYAAAQFNLGTLYSRGLGVPQDNIRAYIWLHLAARQGLKDAVEGLDRVAQWMAASDITMAQDRARAWRPQATQPPPTQPQPTPQAPEPQGLNVVSSGTGFLVSRVGHILTNYHVIDDCGGISSRHGNIEQTLTVIASDPPNDLALLRQRRLPHAIAIFRAGRPVRPGDGVIVVGFPLRGLLASQANVTTGTISALAGLKDDARFVQMTAPVQPGNSGGPLLDQSGHVVGVVASKLDALRVAKAVGDLPQNVNFAIKATIAEAFLKRQGIAYQSAPSQQEHKSADIGEQAQQFTLVVECLQ
jgi:S1-C subfamily serine protease